MVVIDIILLWFWGLALGRRQNDLAEEKKDKKRLVNEGKNGEGGWMELY